MTHAVRREGRKDGNPTFDLLPLLIPAAAVMLALPFGLRTRTEERTVRAVYLFHRSGDPLATVASEQLIPLEPTQLEPVLGAVRDFVETLDLRDRGIHQTSRRFGEEGFVAVRGQYLSACAVFRGRSDGIIRRDLVRLIRDFEERNEGRLGSWEDATGLAGEASLAITGLMGGRGVSERDPIELAPAADCAGANRALGTSDPESGVAVHSLL